MFTGLVQQIGTVATVSQSPDGAVLTIATDLASELADGDSISVSGVCLTARGADSGAFRADVVNETLRRTALGGLARGDAVNLELAMKADGRFGGHIVQGHVDGTGRIESIRADGMSRVVRVNAADDILRYVVERGSIAVDGVSLTVASVDDVAFEVALIPETLAATTLGQAREGEAVNLETDLLAKYAEKLVGSPR